MYWYLLNLAHPMAMWQWMDVRYKHGMRQTWITNISWWRHTEPFNELFNILYTLLNNRRWTLGHGVNLVNHTYRTWICHSWPLVTLTVTFDHGNLSAHFETLSSLCNHRNYCSCDPQKSLCNHEGWCSPTPESLCRGVGWCFPPLSKGGGLGHARGNP